MEKILQVQIGNLTQIQFEALAPFDSGMPWILVHDTESLALAAEICEGVTLQLLGQYATRDAQLILFESSPSSNFAQLKRLLGASNQRWGEQIVTARDCLKRLTELEELIHRRFSLLSQAGAKNIHLYNAQVSRSEPVIFLVISGLRGSLLETQPLEQLELICEQGPAVGIVPILLNFKQKNGEANIPESRKKMIKACWESIQNKATGLDVRGQAPRPINIPDELWALFQRFGIHFGVGELRDQWVNKLLSDNHQAEYDGQENDFLHIRIGLVGAIPGYFSMGEKSDVYHALISGATRTGKTTLLNNLILNACKAYTPDELQLTLMDFKEGVSFWDYEGLGHISQLYAPSECNFSDALQCLEIFEQSITARYNLFRTMRVSRLTDYNRVAQQALPRHMLIVDEAQSLFEGRDFQQRTAVKRILSSVAKKGAAAGLHIILSTQSFQNVDLEGDVKDQFHLRIGFRHASAIGCRALMGRENDAMLKLQRFTAIYNKHQGEEKENRTMALDDLADFREQLDALKSKYPSAQVLKTRLVAEDSLSVSTRVRVEDGDVNSEW